MYLFSALITAMKLLGCVMGEPLTVRYIQTAGSINSISSNIYLSEAHIVKNS
jgi:hypothetical protein